MRSHCIARSHIVRNAMEWSAKLCPLPCTVDDNFLPSFGSIPITFLYSKLLYNFKQFGTWLAQFQPRVLMLLLRTTVSTLPCHVRAPLACAWFWLVLALYVSKNSEKVQLRHAQGDRPFSIRFIPDAQHLPHALAPSTSL